MDVALLSLKVMIAVCATGLVAGVVLVLVGDPDSSLSGTMIAIAIQIGLLFLLLKYLARGSQAAKWIFGLWCAFLFLTGITTKPSLFATIDYALAVLGFVGLAGLWSTRRDNKADAKKKR